MTFLHPEFLYYMLPPLFILFGLLLTQKEAHGDYFSQEVMDRLRVSANTLTLRARNALFFLMGFFIIIALAQPVIKDGKVEIKAKSADIMIALDISDSMLASDVYPNRLESAKQKVLTLLDSAPNERIGIAAFAKNSYLVSPLSFDVASVAFLLKGLDTSSITEKGTDFLSMLEIVGKTQKNQEKKLLLILSDGGDKSDFRDEIELAKKNGIKVFVLGMGTKRGAPIKLQDGTFIKHNGEIIISKINEDIAQLATKTGGVYIENTTSSNDIKTMLREIISISEEKELSTQEIEKNRPLFYYPLFMALLILLIATSSFHKKSLSAKNSIFLLFFLLFANQHVEAGVLDFMDLKKAKEAYDSGDYEASAKLYEEYAQKSKNPESYYNGANAYYKQKKYKEAIESYKRATFDDDDNRAKNFSNLGNAYAKEGDLQKAIESYEESLKIKEEKETRENLKEVERFLEKQESEKSNSDEDKNQEQKESGNQESDKDKSLDKDEKKEKQDSQEYGESGEKRDDEMKNSKGEKEKEPKEDEKKDDEKKEQKNSSDLEKLDKKEEKNEPSEPQEIGKESIMSDAEQMKWIEQLNMNSQSYMYKLNDKESRSLSKDEKPW
ncbi:VWA domain-containing protein [Sulfurimonas sp.]|uniref:VWA domain-containing protein n=1 Tax=Sulfurimonas sp. TaxID=2022749 RepID=UPI0025F7DEB6|nr:VWA domain-containing protein [Sulfurimonas sp.]MBW6489175.1 VWA domain-containing protein [Sulfurimonas sp.]